MKKKLIRVTTVPQSLGSLLRGQLPFMSKYYDVLAVSSEGNGYLKHYSKKEKIKVSAVEMTRQITPIKDLKAAWQLYILFKKEQPFIVHTHTPKAGTLGMIAAFFAKVPHRLHTIAGLPLLEKTGATRKVLDIVEKITYKFATRVYPNSFEMMAIVLQNKYTTTKKLKVLGKGSSNGVDLFFFDPNRYNEYRKQRTRRFLGINDTDFVFLFVGRLVKDKGIEELVEAFDEVNNQLDDVKLLLVGYFEKELDPISEKIIKIIQENKNIIEIGHRRDVRSYMAVSNVLTFPSYREGFPNVVLEAGAMGLPSIVSNINGCNEIIIDGENGIIIPPKNTKALRDSMIKVYKEKRTLGKLAENCRESIAKRFDRKYFHSELLKEYRSLENYDTTDQ